MVYRYQLTGLNYCEGQVEVTVKITTSYRVITLINVLDHDPTVKTRRLRLEILVVKFYI